MVAASNCWFDLVSVSAPAHWTLHYRVHNITYYQNSLFFPEILQKSPYLIFLNSLIKLVELYIINKICSLTWSKDYNKIRLNILPDITWQHVVCSPGPCCGWGTRYDTRSRWTSSLQFSVWSRQAADAPGLLRVKWLEMNGQLGSLRRICISW